jgi:hypothetical protein
MTGADMQMGHAREGARMSSERWSGRSCDMTNGSRSQFLARVD